MDRERFDRLARLLGTTGSRRGALGALLGATLLGIDANLEDGLAKPGKGKGKGRGKSKGKGRDGGVSAQGKKKKGGNNQGGQPDEAGSADLNQAARAGGKCCGARSCARPVNGGNYEECDYSGQNLAGVKAQGASMQKVNGQGTIFSTLAKKSNFQGAHFGRNAISSCLQRSKWAGANLKDANFDAACFFDADLSGAIINSGTNLSSAKFCRTKMPDGTINNRDCDKGTPCCAACDATKKCPSGQVCCEGKCIKGGSCCTPNCTGKQCGPDGCNGSCGTCDAKKCLTCGTGKDAGICISTCDKCQTCDGKGVCKPKCAKCETCDDKGECKPKCGRCQTCDDKGDCVDTCTKCQTCGQDGKCADKCTKCERCDEYGVCKPKCDSDQCKTCDDKGDCVSTCKAEKCEVCDGKGNCNSTCTICQSCDGVRCKDKCDDKQCLQCTDKGECTSKCGPCQKCDGYGKCIDQCDICQTCDGVQCKPKCDDKQCLECDKDGKCVSTCSACQKCDGKGGCEDDCDTKLCLKCGANGTCETICDPKLCLTCGTGEDAGTCVSKCGDCQTCDGKGGCENKCTKCQTCDSKGDCVNACTRCQTCDPAIGCVDKCDADKCQRCDDNGECVSKCGECEECDGNGKCDSDGVECGGVCLECPQNPTTKTRFDGNPALCSGGIRLEVPKDIKAGECKVIERNCGSLRCKTKVCLSANGKNVSFSPVDGTSACKIDKVVVKGGDDANIYTFDPDAVCAADLESPEKNGGTPEVSHIDLCGIRCCDGCVGAGCDDCGANPPCNPGEVCSCGDTCVASSGRNERCDNSDATKFFHCKRDPRVSPVVGQHECMSVSDVCKLLNDPSKQDEETYCVCGDDPNDTGTGGTTIACTGSGQTINIAPCKNCDLFPDNNDRCEFCPAAI